MERQMACSEMLCSDTSSGQQQSGCLKAEDVDRVLATVDIGSNAHKILEVLRIPNIVFHAELRRVKDMLVSIDGHEYPLPAGLMDCVPDEHFVFPKADGKAYATNSLRSILNKVLEELFLPEFPKTTMVSIQRIYYVKRPERAVPLGFTVQPETLKSVHLSDMTLDDDVAALLHGYDLFNLADDGLFYPFILIEAPGGSLLRYDVFKIAAGLPYYIRLSVGTKLPTVDHIGRDTRDNRCCSMRYCTFTQNGRNKCQPSRGHAIFHSVAAGGQLAVQNMVAEHVTVVDTVCAWVTLFDQHGTQVVTDEVLKCSARRLTSKIENLFPETACKHAAYNASIDPTGFPAVAAFTAELYDLMMNKAHETFYKIDEAAESRTRQVLKTAIPAEDFQHRPILAALFASAPESIDASRTFKNKKYLAAIAVDICKLIVFGEYAHPNLLKSLPPRRTVADFFCSLPTPKRLTPVEILNQFEDLIDDKSRASMNLSINCDGTSRFTYTYNAQSRRIVMTPAAASPVAPDNNNNIVLSRLPDKGDTLIMSPYTVYDAPVNDRNNDNDNDENGGQSCNT